MKTNLLQLSDKEMRALRWAVRNTDWAKLGRASDLHADLTSVLDRLQEVERVEVVLALSQVEARALDRAVGNSMDGGADREVFSNTAMRNAAWRGREKLRRGLTRAT